MADLDAVKVVQKTVVVPEHVEYPSVREAFPGGLLKKGDKVRLVVRVLDKDGAMKSETINVVTFKEYPEDAGIEVIGIVKMSFCESAVATAVEA